MGDQNFSMILNNLVEMAEEILLERKIHLANWRTAPSVSSETFTITMRFARAAQANRI